MERFEHIVSRFTSGVCDCASTRPHRIQGPAHVVRVDAMDDYGPASVPRVYQAEHCPLCAPHQHLHEHPVFAAFTVELAA